VNSNRVANHGECLSDECLTDYLEGGLDPVVRSAFESHLVACDRCRENLALFMRILREDVQPEEDVVLQQLEDLWSAQGIQPVPVKKRWTAQVRYLPYAAAGIAALLVVAFWLGGSPFAAKPSVHGRIAQAMLEKARPFEPRVVGQAYMAIDEVTRSAGDPVPAVLAPEMTENSAVAYEVGRYFLLRKEYAKAIRYLRIAVEDPKGVPADVHNDLGVAYIQSGPANAGAAEAEFKGALERSPTHAPALFNLSILYSRLNRMGEARQRTQQYLALDPDSGWAKEIQKLAEEEPAQR
jgi:tetratricopeptide (TPR) repeat protein